GGVAPSGASGSGRAGVARLALRTLLGDDARLRRIRLLAGGGGELVVQLDIALLPGERLVGPRSAPRSRERPAGAERPGDDSEHEHEDDDETPTVAHERLVHFVTISHDAPPREYRPARATAAFRPARTRS